MFIFSFRPFNLFMSLILNPCVIIPVIQKYLISSVNLLFSDNYFFFLPFPLTFSLDLQLMFLT